jgi:hypothetical protein
VKPSLAVYANADDALLLWTVDELDPLCRGFAVERELGGRRAWLDNYAPPGPREYQRGRHQGSDEWPFRSFWWTDHEVEAGDTVRYRVVPVLSRAHAPSEELASEWSEPRTLGSTGAYRAYFNRGFVISQFMSRYLDQHYPGLTRAAALRAFKRDIGADVEDRLRAFLSGHLRTALLELLAGDGDIYAALFELTDEELIRALERLGPRAHVVLANGSVQRVAPETTAQARLRDENEAARTRLRAHGVEVFDRFISPGALGHNKFLVVTGADGKPAKAWTGSTNWSPTGLCTQLNNGLLIDDPGVAAAYLAQWGALRDAGGAHPSALATANGTPAQIGGTSVHFTRARKRVDLDVLGQVVREAREGVLFLMFIPGGSGVVADVRAVAEANPDVLLRGVISELPRGPVDETTGTTTRVRVTLFGDPAVAGPRTYDVVQPRGFEHVAATWAQETTRQQFLSNVGHAIIHSKVLIADPFGDAPVVVTGSHNFSISASEKNDENFVVVRGERTLAEAYAVNVENAWRHYAVRAGTPHAELSGTDYLGALLNDRRLQERFWRLAP